jgi:hypothetical protein
MIETTVIEGEPCYPCLMESNHSRYVVLFDRAGTGTVITRSESHKVGYFSTHWDMSYFKPFTGTIQLRNAQ